METIDEFRNSTSRFRQGEHNALRIHIQNAGTPDQILANANTPTSAGLQPLELPGFSEGTIFTYEPHPNDGLSVVQRKFLTKLRLVLINNIPELAASNCEEYTRDLMSHICECAGLDDGMDLILLPCNLRLEIGEGSFAVQADKEGRRGRELVCIIQEEKHRGTSTYLHGDLQIACAMIAAAQHNYRLFNTVYPPKILGVKIVADRVYFCAISPSEAYLNSLFRGLPLSQDATMLRFPSNGLSLSNPQERTMFLQYLSSLRSELLSLEAHPPVVA